MPRQTIARLVGNHQHAKAQQALRAKRGSRARLKEAKQKAKAIREAQRAAAQRSYEQAVARKRLIADPTIRIENIQDGSAVSLGTNQAIDLLAAKEHD